MLGSISSFCTFKINHGGLFTNTICGGSYIDGLVDHFDFMDMDVFSVHELDDTMTVLGYNDGGIMFYHFMILETNLDSGLLPLDTDQEVIQLARYVPNHKEINLYIEHEKARVVPYFKSPLKVRIEEVQGDHSPEMNRVRMKRKSVGSCSKKLDLNEPTDLSKLIVTYEPVINKKHSIDRESDPFRRYNLRTNKMQNMMGKNLHDVEFFEDEYSGSKESSEDSRSEGNRTNDDSEDEDFFVDLENIIDDADVDMKDFHIHVDADVEWVQKTTKEASGSGVDFTEGEDLEVIDPKSFDSPIIGEDNNRERMLRNIGKAKACFEGVVHPKAFTLGQKFKTKKDVKDYINKHACRGVVPYMSGGPWTKSWTGFKDKTVNMKEGKCPWAVLVSRPKETDDWVVNTLINEHWCVQSRTIKSCNYKFIATNIVKQIESNPTIPVNAIQEDLTQKFEMNMSRMKKQYAILRDYGLELMERNPGTNVKIDCQTEPNLDSNTRTFRTIYICLGALKEGFKIPINRIYPLAYALVENETTYSWTWFLEQLGDDLELYANSNSTFISDRQKGIIPAIAKLYPQVEHRFCLRHIYDNMKRKWKDKELKDLVWACATATTVRHFEKALEELKKFNAEAHH
uniref:MULE transposase domain-containing protein n=1 Tax=Lactuca sativa TaxID=4236 RepID=A0A9R1XMK8_LACSA|nr:hypothetical protein LSAT_V11C300144210 [Lactuca sativa]